MTTLRIHAICLALNEAPFVRNQLLTLYPFCQRISIVTQYDRDWHGDAVAPDETASMVMNHPDPDGKIHFVVRRDRDEAAARNMEMLAFSREPTRRLQTHARPLAEVRSFHDAPDYFLIVDADEFYDVDTLPAILDFLARKRPRGLRVWGYNYVRTWNWRIPRDVVPFRHFGFIRPGVLFEQRRCVSWNESRLGALLGLLRLPNVAPRLWGFEECPPEVGMFHHACWLGDDRRLREKASKSSHRNDSWVPGPDRIVEYVGEFKKIHVPTAELPRNIRELGWAPGFIEPADSDVRRPG